jgi:hypothetical protein
MRIDASLLIAAQASRPVPARAVTAAQAQSQAAAPPAVKSVKDAGGEAGDFAPLNFAPANIAANPAEPQARSAPASAAGARPAVMARPGARLDIKV